MGDQITLGEVHRIVTEIRNDVKAQNGRVNQHTTDIALLQAGQSALKEDAKAHGRNWGGSAGAIAGLIGGFIGGIAKGMFGAHQ